MENHAVLTVTTRNATINPDGTVDVTINISGTVHDKDHTIAVNEVRTINLSGSKRDRKFSGRSPMNDPRQKGKL